MSIQARWTRYQRTDRIAPTSTFERERIQILHEKKHWTAQETTAVMIETLNHVL